MQNRNEVTVTLPVSSVTLRTFAPSSLELGKEEKNEVWKFIGGKI